MAHTLIKMFRQIDQAQQARDALLAGGFTADDVRLDASEDEAGTMAGNFVLARQDTPQGSAAGIDTTDKPPHHRSDTSTNSQAATSGQYILTVEVADDRRAEDARAITERYGAQDVIDPARSRH